MFSLGIVTGPVMAVPADLGRVRARPDEGTAAVSRFVVILPGLVGTMAALDLVGWIFHLPLLTSVFPHYATMKPNTAVCLGLLASACWLRTRRDAGQGVSWLAGGVAGFAAALGAGSLFGVRVPHLTGAG